MQQRAPTCALPHLRLSVHALQAIVYVVPQHAAVGKQRGAHLQGPGMRGEADGYGWADMAGSALIA